MALREGLDRVLEEGWLGEKGYRRVRNGQGGGGSMEGSC